MNLQLIAAAPGDARRATAIAVLVSVLVSPMLSSAAGADGCVKQVFNAFCLGGSPSTLPRPDDAAEPLRFTHQGKQVTVTVDNQRIASVSRIEPPGSWINYVEWRQKLDRLYGRGVDQSDFPVSANSRSSRRNAIITGKGKARMQWTQAGWLVAVIWDHPDHVVLRYELAEDVESGDNNEGL